MKVTNQGSACFVIEISGVKILSDPWIKGLGFINGWSPLLATNDINDFKDVDYLWFSHEHPDHFHPPSINMLAEIWPTFPKVLFQETLNGRVADYLRAKHGADVIEVPTYQDMRLQNDLTITIGDTGIYDSYLQVKDDKYCFTHLNDCNAYSESQFSDVKRFAEDRVHVLTSQYGLAHGPCGKLDEDLIKKYRDQKVSFFCQQVTGIAPEFAIPSSSAIHFCSEDNLWMNKYRVNPTLLLDELQDSNVNILLPVPGKTYDLTDDSTLKNEEEEAQLFELKLNETELLVINQLEEPVRFEKILEAVKKRSETLKKNNNRFIIYFLRKFFGLLAPIAFFVKDLNDYILIDPWNGTVQRINNQAVEDHIEINSYVVHQLYESPYGVDALNASARFDLKGNVTLSKMNNHLNIGTVNTAGIYFRLFSILKPKVFMKLFRVFKQWYKFNRSNIK